MPVAGISPCLVCSGHQNTHSNTLLHVTKVVLRSVLSTLSCHLQRHHPPLQPSALVTLSRFPQISYLPATPQSVVSVALSPPSPHNSPPSAMAMPSSIPQPLSPSNGISIDGRVRTSSKHRLPEQDSNWELEPNKRRRTHHDRHQMDLQANLLAAAPWKPSCGPLLRLSAKCDRALTECLL